MYAIRSYYVLKRMSMKTSARNQFAGTVTGLRVGGVDYEVRIRLDADNEIRNNFV